MILNSYLNGVELYGDDLSLDEIDQWYEDEKEAYANLGASDRSTYVYGYHALNWIHGYRHLPKRRFEHILGVGSAYGDELTPIAAQSSSITILDPSSAFDSTNIANVPVTYCKPLLRGQINLPDASQDLVVCFGVLHHIPNVSYTLTEIERVLKVDGYFLLREPIVSMGDWTYPRPNLTKHERGIPVKIMRKMLLSAGFSIHRENYVDFPAAVRVFRLFRKDVFNSAFLTWIDAILSWIFIWNLRYHATKLHHKFRPTSGFWVLKKEKK